MLIIFCCDPLSPNKVDSVYAEEYAAAQEAGFEVGLISYEDLVYEDNQVRASRRLKQYEEAQLAIYRGWMLKPLAYAKLYRALGVKNIGLINTPPAYQHCHHLPDAYPLIKDYTPRSVWLKREDDGPDYVEKVLALLSEFGASPVVIKDYVKSRKHEWLEACFIPNASNTAQARQVISRFLELQGDDLNEGIVIREYVPLEELGPHPKSGMPLAREYRYFVLDGQILANFNYWDEVDYGATISPPVPDPNLLPRIQSRFFTLDMARDLHGQPIVIELGDGQVAGLPDKADLAHFYQALYQRLS